MTSRIAPLAVALAVAFALTVGVGMAAAGGGGHDDGKKRVKKVCKFKIKHFPPGLNKHKYGPKVGKIIWVGSYNAVLKHHRKHGDRLLKTECKRVGKKPGKPKH